MFHPYVLPHCFRTIYRYIRTCITLYTLGFKYTVNPHLLFSLECPSLNLTINLVLYWVWRLVVSTLDCRDACRCTLRERRNIYLKPPHPLRWNTISQNIIQNSSLKELTTGRSNMIPRTALYWEMSDPLACKKGRVSIPRHLLDCWSKLLLTSTITWLVTKQNSQI